MRRCAGRGAGAEARREGAGAPEESAGQGSKGASFIVCSKSTSPGRTRRTSQRRHQQLQQLWSPLLPPTRMRRRTRITPCLSTHQRRTHHRCCRHHHQVITPFEVQADDGVDYDRLIRARRRRHRMPSPACRRLWLREDHAGAGRAVCIAVTAFTQITHFSIETATGTKAHRFLRRFECVVVQGTDAAQQHLLLAPRG